MALILVKEDGTGKADANSYASVADGDAFHDGHLYAATWIDALALDKATALVMATRVIDAVYVFNGRKAGAEQALQWPRVDCPDPDLGDFVASDAVPGDVVKAVCEMARELLVADRTGSPIGEGLRTTQLSGNLMVFDKRDTRPMVSQLAQTWLNRFGVMSKSRSGSVRVRRT